MLKNKKSLILEALVRIIIAAVILFVIVIPACNIVGELFFYDVDTSSFEEFVDRINEMPSERIEQFAFALQLNKKSAIIGFDSSTNPFKCEGCGSGESYDNPDRTIDKPDSQECIDKACVCLCDKSFEINQITGVGKCIKDFLCKPLNEYIDLVGNTILGKKNFFPWDYKYWRNGFLFTRDTDNANGLGKNTEKDLNLQVERKGSIIGVCNEEILRYNLNKLALFGVTCINQEDLVEEYDTFQFLGEPNDEGIYTTKFVGSPILYYRYIDGAWQWTQYESPTDYWTSVNYPYLGSLGINNLLMISYLKNNNPTPELESPEENPIP